MSKQWASYTRALGLCARINRETEVLDFIDSVPVGGVVRSWCLRGPVCSVRRTLQYPVLRVRAGIHELRCHVTEHRFERRQSEGFLNPFGS